MRHGRLRAEISGGIFIYLPCSPLHAPRIALHMRTGASDAPCASPSKVEAATLCESKIEQSVAVRQVKIMYTGLFRVSEALMLQGAPPLLQGAASALTARLAWGSATVPLRSAWPEPWPLGPPREDLSDPNVIDQRQGTLGALGARASRSDHAAMGVAEKYRQQRRWGR